jgi:hypothetical protein
MQQRQDSIHYTGNRTDASLDIRMTKKGIQGRNAQNRSRGSSWIIVNSEGKQMAHGHDRKYKEDEHVTCPFYKRESDIEIKCEGIVSDVLSNRFKTVQQKNDHKNTFCKEEYCACRLYESLMEKYEGEPV